MIGQRTLHSFFSPAPAKKRGRSPEPGGDAEVAIGGLREPAALEEGRGEGGMEPGGGTGMPGSCPALCVRRNPGGTGAFF